MLIITGTGRSGTETLARMFGGYHEFRVSYILEKYFLKADPLSNPFDTIEKRIVVMLDLHQGIDRDTFVDSSNLYIHFIDAVYILNPPTKFILTVRNGRDFVRSAISRRWHEKNTFGTVPQRDNPYFSRWDKMSPLQKNAWIWDYRNRKALEGLSMVPEKQKIIVKAEDINSHRTINSVEVFSGINIREKELADRRWNANPSFDFPPKEEWTDNQNSEFDEIAGEMMRFFGYD